MVMWYFLNALRKYAVFSGRATRKEYWYFWLVCVLSALVILSVGGLMGPAGKDVADFVFGAFLLSIVVPSLAVTVRRLHDIGRSGWWILIGVVPLGGIVIWVFAALPSESGENQYGPNPLVYTQGPTVVAELAKSGH
jgi:uncharacterized membrane protein YhaH (DUF805 family)